MRLGGAHERPAPPQPPSDAGSIVNRVSLQYNPPMLTQRQLHAHRRVAVRAAHVVGPLLLRWSGRPLRVTTKRSPIDLVTEVDRSAERMIYRTLHRAYPAYGFWGEESGRSGDREGLHWCVDPIDGTSNFVHGFPMFCTSIALVDGVQPLVGVIYDPTRRELFTSVRGGGRCLNGRRLRVSRVRRLTDSLFSPGFPSEFRRAPNQFLRPFRAFQLATHAVRRTGSAALNLAYVACGRLDGVWEERIWPWDVAAALLLIEESGGRATTFAGRAFRLSDNHVLATNGRVHTAALATMRQAKPLSIARA